MKSLINPFKHVAGWKAFAYGVTIMLLSAFASTLSNTHFDGVLDVHFHQEANFSAYIAEHLMVWLLLILVFGITALILNGPRFRLLDLAGMTAFSRIPISITAFLALALDATKVISFIKFEFMGIGEELVLTNYDIGAFITLILISIVLIIWSLTWLYHALKILANSSGAKLTIAFILALIISETLSKLTFWLVPGFDLMGF